MSRDWNGEQRRLEDERDAARAEVERLSQLMRPGVSVMRTPDGGLLVRYRAAKYRLDDADAALADMLQERALEQA